MACGRHVDDQILKRRKLERDPDISKLRAPDGDWIGAEELQEILADEGYSAGNREMYLKALLTELTRATGGAHRTERGQELLAEVRRILAREQGKSGQSPISDDTI